ncbi:MAG: phosphoribosylanthranilate isomerase [Cellvibrionaceae bacterium]
MTGYTRTKICGLTTKGDALVAANCGVDAIGLIFFAESPRAVSRSVARDIALAVGPFVTVVGLFVDAEPEFVDQVIATVPLQVLQFHGTETPDYCERFKRPYLKAIKVRPLEGEEVDQTSVAAVRQDILTQAARFTNARGILLDTLSSQAQGGTGQSFDWRCVPENSEHHWILAGGLNPTNVEAAVRAVRPYGVDVSSGVELSRGVKDPKKIRQFIDRVRAANY